MLPGRLTGPQRLCQHDVLTPHPLPHIFCQLPCTLLFYGQQRGILIDIVKFRSHVGQPPVEGHGLIDLSPGGPDPGALVTNPGLELLEQFPQAVCARIRFRYRLAGTRSAGHFGHSLDQAIQLATVLYILLQALAGAATGYHTSQG